MRVLPERVEGVKSGWRGRGRARGSSCGRTLICRRCSPGSGRGARCYRRTPLATMTSAASITSVLVLSQTRAIPMVATSQCPPRV